MARQANSVLFNQDFFAPVKALNELALANVEKLVEMNLATMHKYSDITLDAWKAALDVKDVQGMQEYVARQGEVAKEVVEGMVADAKEVAKLSQDYAAGAQKIAVEKAGVVVKKAA